MKIEEILTSGPKLIVGDASICEAARMMRNEDVGMLPVVEGPRLIGTVTDRDITVRATAEGHDPLATKVRDIMTADSIFCFQDRPVEEAAELMEQNQIRRLPILDRDNRLIGVLSLSDLVVKGNDEQMTGKVLEQVCAC